MQGITILFFWNSFRRIERLLHISHVLVTNWAKKAAKQIKEKSTKRSTKIDILELYEICINFKKTSGYRPQLIEKVRK